MVSLLNYGHYLDFVYENEIAHEPQLVKCSKEPKIEKKNLRCDYDISCEKAQS